ncbi:hypothetical protein [Planomicrobium okeanokoites]|uniref:hypothetical protein n=1 Tax=Planomicrobium okeanokoites TaxID=244 RepID=UPI002491C972|nr:hypothetical protein [Planomicrobium okeanokoites]
MEQNNIEKRKRPLSSDKRKTIWRSGVFPAAQPKWLTTRGVGRWSLDNRKAETAAQLGSWSLKNKEKRG